MGQWVWARGSWTQQTLHPAPLPPLNHLPLSSTRQPLSPFTTFPPSPAMRAWRGYREGWRDVHILCMLSTGMGPWVPVRVWLTFEYPCAQGSTRLNKKLRPPWQKERERASLRNEKNFGTAFGTRGSTFYFWTGPHKLRSWFKLKIPLTVII